ncbi:hypothetical protein FRC07_006203 [Ceratobasidium sp. 392]|nr:hypothetical protein FRC07_006203 [Ceratobasidium sp. 392]
MRDERVKLMRNLDVTKWADDMDDHSDRTGSDEDGENRRGPWGPRRPTATLSPTSSLSSSKPALTPKTLPAWPLHRLEPGGPGRGPPGRGVFALFARYASWEWLRAASHTYNGLGEARVKLRSGWHVTSHGIAPTSNGITRVAQLPADSIATWRKEVDQMLQMALRQKHDSSGVDWRALTDLIVDRYGDRLPELSALLKLAHSSISAHTSGSNTNATIHIQHAYRLVSSILLSFYDRNASREEQVEICTFSIPPDLAAKEGEANPLNQYERKIWSVVVHVHRSICATILDIHSGLEAFRPLPSGPNILSLEQMSNRVDELISQLDWPGWVRCPDVCPWGQVCFIPIWPLLGFGSWPGWPREGRPEPHTSVNAYQVAYSNTPAIHNAETPKGPVGRCTSKIL